MSTPEVSPTTTGRPADQSNNSPREFSIDVIGNLDRPSNGKESTDSETLQEPSDKGRSIQGFRWIIICFSIYMTCALYGLDTTIAADVQGPVIADLGHVEKLAWGKSHQVPIEDRNISSFTCTN